MRTVWFGGLAALCLAGLGSPAGAQIHNNPVMAQAHPVMSAAPMQPKAPVQSGWRAARYHDCMHRYHDKEGCRYLAWRRLDK